jgi:glycine/D-amino acid oxidase-like deaminating enzyme
MHAAVTLAPIMGRLIAAEIVDGVVEPALSGSRLDRF